MKELFPLPFFYFCLPAIASAASRPAFKAGVLALKASVPALKAGILALKAGVLALKAGILALKASRLPRPQKIPSHTQNFHKFRMSALT